MKAEDALEYLAQFPGETYWISREEEPSSGEFDWSDVEFGYHRKFIRRTSPKWWIPSLGGNILVRIFVTEKGTVTRAMVQNVAIGWP